MTDQSGFHETPLPSIITTYAVQITSTANGVDSYACGTAVIVAPHLAFSVRHVLEDHWRRYYPSKRMPLSGELTAGFSLVLVQLVGDAANLWLVRRLWTTELTDIVLLKLTPYSSGAQSYKFGHLNLDVLPPQVGEHVHAFGYTESLVQKAAAKEVTLSLKPMTTHGTVVEVFNQGRDPVMLPFPSFQTNARFDGGMSGGPVFNQSGQLCGLVCSTYPPFSADEDHASFVVSLWPAMAIPIDLNRRGHPQGVRYRTFDLLADNILVGNHAECLEVGPIEENGTSQISLRAPRQEATPP